MELPVKIRTWEQQLTEILIEANFPCALWVDFCVTKTFDETQHLKLKINTVHKAICIAYVDGKTVVMVHEKPEDETWSSVVSKHAEYVGDIWRQPLKTNKTLIGRLTFIKHNNQDWHDLKDTYKTYREPLARCIRAIRWQQTHDVKRDTNCYKMLQRAVYQYRSPLQGLVSTAQLLQNTNLSTYQTTLLTTLQENTFLLMGLSNDLLDLTGLELGEANIRRERVDILSLIYEVWRIVVDDKPEKVPLTIWIEEEVPERFYSDHARIRQVLVNLVQNAYKFTEKGGICVKVRISDQDELNDLIQKEIDTPWGNSRAPKTDSADEAAGVIAIDVIDTGIGIPEKSWGDLFVQFKQGNINKGGSGLGLSLVYKIIEAMGGGVDMWSKYKTGSRFTFIIPVEFIRPSGTPNLDVDDKKVLMIGDPSSLRQWTNYIKGTELRECIDFKRAWSQHLSHSKVDIVVMQIGPEWSEAIEICQSINHHPRGKDYVGICIGLGVWPVLPAGNGVWAGMKMIIPGKADWRFGRALGKKPVKEETVNAIKHITLPILHSTKTTILFATGLNFKWISQMLNELGYSRIYSHESERKQWKDATWVFVTTDEVEKYKKWKSKYYSSHLTVGLGDEAMANEVQRVIRMPPTESDISVLIELGSRLVT